MTDKKLTTEEAAEYLGYSAGTIENWRRENPYKGPKYYKPMGKVFYFEQDLKEWLESNKVERQTK